MHFCSTTILLALTFFGLATAEWVQVWSEEFEGAILDENTWSYEEGCQGGGNDELQCYTVRKTDNVRIEDGHLVIHAQVQPLDNKRYTSGRIVTKAAWTYGKFEVKAKLPQGKHLWPAIWMMPKKSMYGMWAASGEIDIMEYRGQKTHTTQGALHYGGSWPNQAYSGSGEHDFPVAFNEDYHVFALEWTEKEVKWLVDDAVYHVEPIDRSMWSGKGDNPYSKNGSPFDTDFFFVLNIAVGGAFFPKDPYGDLTLDEARKWEKPTMEVDYLRVSQWKE